MDLNGISEEKVSEEKIEKSGNFGKDSGNGSVKKNNGPVSDGWISLGVGRGIKWVLWPTNVVFARQEKQGDKWLTTEELHVAPSVLKEIAWRAAHWLEAIDKNGKNSKGE
jgi:hypothetical protein